MNPALTARLLEIADDPSWPIPLRIAAKYTAAGDLTHAINPSSLADADIRAALVDNMVWRRDQPAAADCGVKTVHIEMDPPDGFDATFTTDADGVHTVHLSDTVGDDTATIIVQPDGRAALAWRTTSSTYDGYDEQWWARLCAATARAVLAASEVHETTVSDLANEDVRDNYEIAYRAGSDGDIWLVSSKDSAESIPDTVRWRRIDALSVTPGVVAVTVAGYRFESFPEHRVVVRKAVER